MVQKRVLVIGASGFIGRALFARLNAAPRWIALDSREYHLDLLDIDTVRRAIDVAKPDIIVNLAAVSTLDQSNIPLIYRLNCQAVVDLCDHLVATGFGGRFINTSSCLVYGVHTPLPITEKTALAPTLHYAIAKAAADQCLAQLKDKVDAVAVRPFNCIGRDHGPQFLVPKLVRHFRERQPEIILGTTSNKRDFVDVRDMAAMYEAVMIAERVPPAVNFCSATAISADDIISTLTDMTGHRIRVIADPQLMRSIDNPYMCGDNSTIRKLGYIPSFSLRDTLAWMLEA